MRLPGFSLLKYGQFDSTDKFPDATVSRPRLVTAFEIEYYTADHVWHTHINDREIPLIHGQLIVAKPGQIRYSHLPFRCLYIHLSDVEEPLFSKLLSIADARIVEKNDVLHTSFARLSHHTGDRLDQQMSLFADVHGILAYLLAENAPDEIAPHRAMWQKMRVFIEENLGESLSLAVLAERANLSPTYFHRLFTEEFGIPPARYVLERRLAAAQMALLREDASIAEVAADCGFSSQSYFSAKFRQATGRAPLEYRREMRRRPEI